MNINKNTPASNLSSQSENFAPTVQHVNIKRLQKRGIIKDAAWHNLREMQAELETDSNINPSKTNLNYILHGQNNSLGVANEAQALMDDAKVGNLRKDAVRGLEILFSLSPQSTIEHNPFFIDCLAWSKQYFEIPILSAVVHLDESAPHCHIIMLPLIDGKMVGSSFIHKPKLKALQEDFHTQVGQKYGLIKKVAQKRHSAAVRNEAAEMILTTIKDDLNALDDVTMGLLKDCIAQNPEPLIQALKLNMPRNQSKHKTCAAIMTQDKPERKLIGFCDDEPAKKNRSLPCVGFRESTPHLLPSKVSPTGNHSQSLNIVQVDTAEASHSSKDEYVREREDEQPADYWDEIQGEFICPPTNTKSAQPYGNNQ